jgi:hypothetical protein
VCFCISCLVTSTHTVSSLLISVFFLQELFLRSPPSEIAESLQELNIICATIGERCLAKLCEWEGREDTGRQKASIISVGIRAKKCFLSRAKVAKPADGDDEDDGEEPEETSEDL